MPYYQCAHLNQVANFGTPHFHPEQSKVLPQQNSENQPNQPNQENQPNNEPTYESNWHKWALVLLVILIVVGLFIVNSNFGKNKLSSEGSLEGLLEGSEGSEGFSEVSSKVGENLRPINSTVSPV